MKKVSIDENSASEWEEYIYKKNLNNHIIRKLCHCPMALLQSLKEKKSKQSINIDYIDNKIQMTQANKHIANLLTRLAVTFSKLVIVRWHRNTIH